MNLYLRYFDQETFVSSVEEALDFLRSIPEINLTPEMEADIRDYASRDVYFPKRYKVRPRVYFIVIKTSARLQGKEGVAYQCQHGGPGEA